MTQTNDDRRCPDENGKCGYEECRDDRYGSIGSCYEQGWHGLDCPSRKSHTSCEMKFKIIDAPFQESHPSDEATFTVTCTTSKCRHGKDGYFDCDACRLEIDVNNLIDKVKSMRSYGLLVALLCGVAIGWLLK
jgi:hypothetical protein